MITVTLEIVLDGYEEDLADVLDNLVSEALMSCGIYPSSVLIDRVEED
jgi:hypothetical protein